MKKNIIFSSIFIFISCNPGIDVTKLKFQVECEDINVEVSSSNKEAIWWNQSIGEDLSVLENTSIEFKATGQTKEIKNLGWFINNKKISEKESFSSEFKSESKDQIRLDFKASSGNCSKNFKIHTGKLKSINLKIDPIADVCEQVMLGMICITNNITKVVSPLYFEKSQKKICWNTTSVDFIETGFRNQILTTDTNLKFELISKYSLGKISDLGYVLNLFNSSLFLQNTVNNPQILSSVVFTSQNTKN